MNQTPSLTLHTIAALTVADHWQHLASQAPDAPCILYPGRDPLSFGQLYEQIERVQQTLRRAGFSSSSRIAGALPDGAEAAVAFHAVTAACAYAPLNVSESQPFFEAVLRRLEPSAVLVTAQSQTYARSAAHTLRIPIIELEPLASAAAGIFELHCPPSSTGIRREAAPTTEDLAMLLLTSGSTAEPKFVMHTHRTLLASARRLANAFALESSDRSLIVSPLFHSLGTTGGLMLGNINGGSIITIPRFEADLFFEWMDELRPTWFSAVPSALEAIHDAAPRHQEVLDRIRLRFFRTVAAPMNPVLARRLEKQFNAPLIHVYGMSEAAPISVQPFNERKSGSVGVAASGVELSIRGEDGMPVPQGDTGEITVRGEHIARGYFRDPASTARAFRGGSDFFHTGDQGYLDPGGHLFLTGRIHDIINRGGAKISPREIESVFETNPDVAAAIAFPIPHPVLGEEVALAVVRREAGHSIGRAQLQRYATSRLAFHKIPRQFLFLDRIPLLPSGKPDRRILPRLFEEHDPAEHQQQPAHHEPPRNDLERQLAAAWTGILGIENPSIHDSFFESGGDSLAAARFLMSASDISGRGESLSPQVLFEAPSIAELALLLSATRESSTREPRVVPVQPSGSRPALFCIVFDLELRDLTPLLGPDQPVFFIRLPEGLDGGPMNYTVERVAAGCLAALRHFQPHGPYQLAGWCFAGVVAFEMARQLSLAGEQVPAVLIFDAHNILPLRSPIMRWFEDCMKLKHHLGIMAKQQSTKAAAQYFAGRARTVGRRVYRTLWRVSKESAILALSPDHFNGLALERYRPEPPYDGGGGTISHFWCTGGPPHPGRPFPGEWAPYVRGCVMTLDEIPGNHVSMFQSPNVEVLARKIQDRMSQVRARG